MNDLHFKLGTFYFKLDAFRAELDVSEVKAELYANMFKYRVGNSHFKLNEIIQTFC